MGKRKNSRAKGANGEREAAQYLTGLGFKAERSARNGVRGCNDLIVHDLPNVSIEVKRVQGLDIGTKAMEDIIEQAIEDADKAGRWHEGAPLAPGVFVPKAWAVLWRRNNICWRLTYHEHPCGIVTQTGDVNIAAALRRLNRG